MPRGLTQCDEGNGGLCFKCIFCPEVFASRNGLFKHLRAEHPSAHNRRCDRCKIFPVIGVCYECSESKAVLCSKCYGDYESEVDPDSTCSTSSTFSKHDFPQHMQGRAAQQAQPNRERRELREPAEPPICNALRPPLQFGPSKLPKSLVDAFNKHASAEMPLFRIPSKTLRDEVPLEDLEFAWSNQLLCGMPVGIKSTFAHADKDQWLHLAMEDPDRDVVLSPLQPLLTSELLLAILRFQTFETEIACLDVRRIAKSTWNCGNSTEEWGLCAEKTHNVKIHRQRGSFGHKSASISIQHTGKVGQPLDFEDFAFSFLQKVNGQEFYSTPSLAESMFLYGQDPEAKVPPAVCYNLVWRARQIGCVQPCKDGRSDGALLVKLDGWEASEGGDTAVVAVCDRKHAKSWKNSCDIEDEMDFGSSRVQKLRLSEAGQLVAVLRFDKTHQFATSFTQHLALCFWR